MRKKTFIYIMIFLTIIQWGSFIVHGEGTNMSQPLYYGIENGDSHFRNVSFSDIKNHWAKEAIYEIASLRYMIGYGGKFSPNRQLTNAEAITTIVRAMGLEAEAQKKDSSSWEKGYYEVAAENEIIPKPKSDTLEPNPKSKATREDVAYYIGKALKISPKYGDEIIEAIGFKDFNKFDKKKLPHVEGVLQKGYMQGMVNKTFKPKGYITRSELAQVIYNANDELVKNRNITKKEGQIVKKRNVSEYGNKVTYYTVLNIDGKTNNIKFDKRNKNIFPVQKTKTLYYPSVLKESDYMKYYINPNGQVLYGKVLYGNSSNIEGNIKSINYKNSTITVLDFSNREHNLKINPSTNIEIEGKPANRNDLYYGQEVKILLSGNRVQKIIGIEAEDPDRDGYIIPGTRFAKGDVLFVSNKGIEIKGVRGREKYRINKDSTKIIKNDKTAKLFQIKEGDKVLLTFDDIYTSEVSEIKIEDDELHIDGVLKGNIELVDERNKEIILNKPTIYDGGTWKDYGKSKLKLKYRQNSAIYDDGVKLPLSKLKTKKGEEAYIAFDRSYGNMNISKLLLKSGSSMNHNARIEDIEYGTRKMIVDGNTIYFDPGTIVLKDNRLVDSLNLEKNQNVYVHSDYSKGKKVASIVSIVGSSILDDRIDGTRLCIYKGNIEDIYDYNVKIGKIDDKLNYLILDDNRFVQSKGSKRFTLTDDTLIFDSELKKSIPTKYFIDSRYIDLEDIKHPELRERLQNNFYKDKIAYFVTRKSEYGEEVLAMNLAPNLSNYKETAMTDYATIGNINEVDADAGKIEIVKAKNYNTLNNRWESISNGYLDINDAIVLVNDTPLPKNEIYRLKSGSKVYILKNKSTSEDKCYIMLVEQ